MKRLLTSLAACSLLTHAANSQVYINELLVNPPGSDSTATLGLEYFELRGTPNLSLAGYYLISIEGQGTTTGRGDINQFFDLGSFSLGANGFLFARQYSASSPYTPVNGSATLAANSVGQGWGQVNVGGSSVGHSGDGTQFDLENSATTLLLVNIGSGVAPTLTLDLDTTVNDDGILDLPAGWTLLDSIGVMDASGTPAATDLSYGAITFRQGTVGGSAYGNIVTMATGSNLYVGRKGDSTGSTTGDWVASALTGSGGNFVFGPNTTDPSFIGLPLTIMQFGATNAPEPATWALLGLGLLTFGFIRRRR